MKSFNDNSFFLLFDLIVSRDNPDSSRDNWVASGVEWEKMSHSFSESRYGYRFDIVILAHSGRNGWTLIVVKEYWWAGKRGDSVKSLRWAKPLRGQRSDIVRWFAEQKRLLEVQSGHISRQPATS